MNYNRVRAPIAVLATLILVGGCQPGPDLAAMDREANAGGAKCRADFAAGVINSRAAQEKCIWDAWEASKVKYGGNTINDDEYRAYWAKRVVIAGKVDRGEIREDEATAERAQALVDFNTATQLRVDSATAGSNATSGQPTFTTCSRVATRIGPQMNCTSY